MKSKCTYTVILKWVYLKSLKYTFPFEMDIHAGIHESFNKLFIKPTHVHKGLKAKVYFEFFVWYGYRVGGTLFLCKPILFQPDKKPLHRKEHTLKGLHKQNVNKDP